MKKLTSIFEAASKGEWCLWDYEFEGEREVLIWKGNGRDMSDVTEYDENGTELMNVKFDDIVAYCKEHKSDPIDKWHFDFSNAKVEKLESVF